MSCGACRAVPCTVGLRLVGWTTPSGVAHVVCRGYPGSYPPQWSITCITSKNGQLDVQEFWLFNAVILFAFNFFSSKSSHMKCNAEPFNFTLTYVLYKIFYLVYFLLGTPKHKLKKELIWFLLVIIERQVNGLLVMLWLHHFCRFTIILHKII